LFFYGKVSNEDSRIQRYRATRFAGFGGEPQDADRGGTCSWLFTEKEIRMARYGKAAAKTVRSAMRRRKRGTLKSGKGGKGGTVKSRKQAIAIGLSEARKKGAKVPPRKKSS
jgi:hypothetical protein